MKVPAFKTIGIVALLLLQSTLIYAGHDAVLVLGSGGTKGMAHIGAIEELAELDIRPTTIVGCSAGAIVAALYAQSQDIEQVKNIALSLNADDLLDISLLRKNSLSSRKSLERFLHEHIIISDFSELPIKLVLVATDFETGEATYFSEGSVIDAILASTSLPGVFRPYVVNDERTYVDGGLSDPLPCVHAKSLDRGKVLAIDVSPALGGFKDSGILNILRKSFEIIYQNLCKHTRDEADLTLQLNFEEDALPTDGSKNQEFYQRGRKIVRENSTDILELFS